MKYRVVWTRAADSILHTHEFLARETGGDFERLIDAYYKIEQELAEDPHLAGESRCEPERVAFADPFTVYYEVFESSKIMLIYTIHRRHLRSR